MANITKKSVQAKPYGNYAEGTVGFDILNGGIAARENGLRVLSRESDRQKLLGELATKATQTKDPAEKKSIKATLNKFGYKPDKPVSKATPPKAAPIKQTPSQQKTYTVKGGKKSKTFATLKEAKDYEKELKRRTGKNADIIKGTKKPTHKIVNFISKLENK